MRLLVGFVTESIGSGGLEMRPDLDLNQSLRGSLSLPAAQGAKCHRFYVNPLEIGGLMGLVGEDSSRQAILAWSLRDARAVSTI